MSGGPIAQNQTGNAHMTSALRRVRSTIVAVEKQ